jgi:hypothetical protein
MVTWAALGGIALALACMYVLFKLLETVASAFKH